VIDGGNAKTRRGKKALEARDPKLVENTKIALLIKGPRTSQVISQVLKDVAQLKKPDFVSYSRRNVVHPFEDASLIERWGQRSDSSLFAFGSSSKKRPDYLILGRLFDYHILDMIEFAVVHFQSIDTFKGEKWGSGSKPSMIIAGEQFKTDPTLFLIANLFLDFFRGEVVSTINLSGLDRVIVLSLKDGKIQFRHYLINFKKSGTKIPRVELEEMGPSLDLVVKRTRIGSDDLRRTASKKPILPGIKKPKNISTTETRDTVGRLHLPSQDLDTLTTRKVRALKKRKYELHIGTQNNPVNNDISPQKKTENSRTS